METPLPPPHLVDRVAGTKDEPWFIEGGRRGYESTRDCLAQNGVDPDTLESALDFGCGCGRVLRHWKESAPANLAGCDRDPELVEWCHTNLPFADVITNGLEPPLPYPAASFEFVYALSVFTHLGLHLQLPWLRELGRVLTPGGMLALTLHGESYMDGLDTRSRERFASGCLVVRGEEQRGTNQCATYHPSPLVHGLLAPCSGFEVIDFRPEGGLGTPTQDLYLLRRLENPVDHDAFLKLGRWVEPWFLPVMEMP